MPQVRDVVGGSESHLSLSVGLRAKRIKQKEELSKKRWKHGSRQAMGCWRGGADSSLQH